MIEEHLDCIPLSGTCRHHQCRFPPRQDGGIRVNAGFQQRLNHRRASVHSRKEHRRRSCAVRRLRHRSGPDQSAGHFQIIPSRGPVQGRRTVGLWSVDVRFLLKEGAQRFTVLFHGCVRDVAGRGCMGGDGE